MNKTLKNTFWFSILLILVVATMLFASLFISKNAYAQESTNEQDSLNSQSETEADEATPYGLYVVLSISIDCGDGKVWTTVKNDFTLFPATVNVVVELYSSTTYTDNYQNMTLESVNSTSDLNMGKTIRTEASTGGTEKYWLGRMRYKKDKGAWKTKDTGVYRIGANGEFLGPV